MPSLAVPRQMRRYPVVLLLCAAPMAASTEEIIQALRAHRFNAALELCRQEQKVQPNSSYLHVLEGLALQNMKRSKEALSAFRQACRLSPRSLPALEATAQLEYQIGDPRAETTLARILAIKPDSTPAHGMLGVLAYEKKQCSLAVEHFAKAGDQLDRNPRALWQYGNCLFELRRPGEAAARFQSLLAMENDDLVRYNLSLSLLEAKKAPDAVAALTPLTQRERPDSDVLSLIAAAYEADKQTPKALETLRRAVDIYPREERHYIDFASICMEHSSLDIGVEVLEVGTRNIPASARLHATLGALLVRAGQMQRAKQEFETAQALDPKAAYGNIGLSLAMLQADRIDESIHLLRAQLAQDAGNPMVGFMLAQALFRTGAEPGSRDFDEAQRLLQSTVRKQPDHARAHGLLGKSYAMANDVGNALRELETAVTLDPSDRASAYQLALLYGRTGQDELSAKWQQRVRDLLEAERNAEREQNRFLIIRAAPKRVVTE